MSDNVMFTEDEFLEHYGVKGMKWGKRSGSIKDRIKGAALDSIQRRKASNKAIASGEGKLRDYGRAASFRAGGAFTFASKKVAQKRVDQLDQSEARIKAGKASVRDVVEALNTVRLSDLVISRTDKRG